MAVAGKGIGGCVAEDPDPGMGALHGGNGAANEIVRIERLVAFLALEAEGQHGKDGDHRNAEFGGAPGFLDQGRDRESRYARHRRDILASGGTVLDEDRPDEIGGGGGGFGNPGGRPLVRTGAGGENGRGGGPGRAWVRGQISTTGGANGRTLGGGRWRRPRR